MPAIVVLGILSAIVAVFVVLAMTFFSVIFESKSAVPALSQDEARSLFLKLSHRRVDPSDEHSPTIGDVVRFGHLDELMNATRGERFHERLISSNP